MKKFISFAVTAIALLAMASCGGSSSKSNPFVGEYEGIVNIVIKADGTGTFAGQPISYKVDGSTITLSSPEADETFELTLKGDDLMYEGIVFASRAGAAVKENNEEEDEYEFDEDEYEEPEDVPNDEYAFDEEMDEEEEIETVSSVSIDEFLDKYESIVDRYIKLYKKALAGDMSALSESAELAEEISDPSTVDSRVALTQTL